MISRLHISVNALVMHIHTSFSGLLGQTVAKLMTQCNEKAFELEVSSFLAMLECFLSNQFISKILIFVCPSIFGHCTVHVQHTHRLIIL